MGSPAFLGAGGGAEPEGGKEVVPRVHSWLTEMSGTFGTPKPPAPPSLPSPAQPSTLLPTSLLKGKEVLVPLRVTGAALVFPVHPSPTSSDPQDPSSLTQGEGLGLLAPLGLPSSSAQPKTISSCEK